MKDPQKTQVIVSVGAGGVGKTTVSGMLGLDFSRRGKKTLVITIDPAKRLLDALDMSGNTHVPLKVDISKILPDEKISGELFAFMPDLRREWKDFLSSSLKNTEAIHEISENPFYQYMVDGLPGSLEIICAHILHRLLAENNFDVIILDTPPASNSLSFFDVPSKIARVLEHNIFRLLMKQRHSLLSKFTRKIAFFSSGLLEKTLEKLIGSHFLSEVIDFALTIDAIYEPMLERARAMDAMLKNPHTHFVLISRPTVDNVRDSIDLQAALKKRSIHINQLVINQVLFEPGKNLAKERRAFREQDNGHLEKLLFLFEEEYKYQQKLIRRLKDAFIAIDSRLLFLAKNSESSLMTQMLSDYNQE
jgi:anion-transporting  ArsA/GET3 family ATPase